MSQHTPHKKSSRGFSALPFELREKVWQHVLPSRVLQLDSELMFLHHSPLRRPVISEDPAMVHLVDASTDSFFFQASNMIDSETGDFGFLNYVTCRGYRSNQEREFPIELRALIANDAHHYLSAPMNLCVQVPSSSLTATSDYEGLAVVDNGTWKHVRIKDCFGWISVACKLPAEIETIFFPEGATTCLIDICDVQRLSKLCRVHENTGSREHSMAYHNLSNLQRILEPRTREAILRHKEDLLRFNWLCIRWWSLSSDARERNADVLVVQSSVESLVSLPGVPLATPIPAYDTWHNELQLAFNQDSAWVQNALQAMPTSQYAIVLERK
ncbi:hypothetical protein SUNI508_02282 [Seiridium unicorne]|uniref:Uncharacterized protein n=1 Tax=Seiridium unicorne TaxID=138068 RepID=A0ABR2UHT7_9PEZI